MPQRGSYKSTKLAPCSDCGQDTYRRARNTRVPRCLDCSVARFVQNAEGMARREYAVWERWREGMARSLDHGGMASRGSVNISED